MFLLSLFAFIFSALADVVLSDLLSGSCPDNKFPTEAQYIAGYNTFCDTYMPLAGYYPLDPETPIVSTSTLIQANGETVKWVYKISVWWKGTQTPNLVMDHYLNRVICKSQFQALLDSNDAGGMGTAWCVVDGTGGDKGKMKNSGSGGTVCVKGGVTKIGIQKTGQVQMIFANYRLGSTL